MPGSLVSTYQIHEHDKNFKNIIGGSTVYNQIMNNNFAENGATDSD